MNDLHSIKNQLSIWKIPYKSEEIWKNGVLLVDPRGLPGRAFQEYISDKATENIFLWVNFIQFSFTRLPARNVT